MTGPASGSALVTGGGRGIGRAIAAALVAAGFDTRAGVRGPTEAPAAPEVILDMADLGDFTPPDDLTVLVNNAGLDSRYLPAEHLPLEDWRAIFEVNVFGLVELTQRCLPVLRANGGGVIVNVTSSSLAYGMPLYGCYRASKAAVAAFSSSMRPEVEPLGIRVIEVPPGPVQSDMLTESDRLPEASEHAGYESLATDVWEMRRSVDTMITPADVAAAHIVAAILDDTVNGIVACDPMGADLMGAPLL
jgi:NAD(P)-dependent dehydrogenase (short-subunit alcohol dehydrogenase family)